MEERDFHYIGRSDIKKNKVYFFVSENMIPEGKGKQPVFSKRFLNDLVKANHIINHRNGDKHITLGQNSFYQSEVVDGRNFSR